MLEECTRPGRRRDVAIRLHEEDSAFRRVSQSCPEATNHGSGSVECILLFILRYGSVRYQSSEAVARKRAKKRCMAEGRRERTHAWSYIDLRGSRIYENLRLRKNSRK